MGKGFGVLFGNTLKKQGCMGYVRGRAVGVYRITSFAANFFAERPVVIGEDRSPEARNAQSAVGRVKGMRTFPGRMTLRYPYYANQRFFSVEA